MSLNDKAAAIHRYMCLDPGFGYDWSERWGGPVTVQVEGVTLNVGDYDCSSSTITAWRKAVEGTPYEGRFDGATYTGNMRDVFLASGLFDWVGCDEAQPGDLYLNEECHVAMCQPGGQLSEFSGNEWGGVYGGERGDQTGWESHICGYYWYPWDGCLHYNGRYESEDDVSAQDVWNYGLQGPNVSLSAGDRIIDIESYLHDDSDPTGRDKKADMKTRIAWMAKKQEDQQEQLDRIEAMLSKLVKGDE